MTLDLPKNYSLDGFERRRASSRRISRNAIRNPITPRSSTLPRARVTLSIMRPSPLEPQEPANRATPTITKDTLGKCGIQWRKRDQ